MQHAGPPSARRRLGRAVAVLATVAISVVFGYLACGV
jgi:hypothetical protein